MAELKWVTDRYNDEFYPALTLASTEEDVKLLCLEEIAYWKSRVKTAHSLRNPHTQTRNLIKDSALSDSVKEWVFEHLNFSEEEWAEMNAPSIDALHNRLSNQQFLSRPDVIVEQGQVLLQSEKWADIAAGLALVTGRRATEILQTADFQPCTEYTVLFTGQLKQRGHFVTMEIPTLVPASQVLEAYARLRQMRDTSSLSSSKVSALYNKPFAASVRKHFETLIPARDGKGVSPHVLRAVYFRLAIFFFCPIGVDAEHYVAAISGHYSRDAAGNEHLSHAAGPNYSDYKIADANGNIDGRQGVKLGVPGVTVLSVFSKAKHRASGQIDALNGIVESGGTLTPEMLFAGDDCQKIRDGMQAAGMVDFISYLKKSLLRQAATDIGVAKRDAVEVDLSNLSMDELLQMKKTNAAYERIRRGIAAIATHNESADPMARWFINSTVLNQLIGGRFETIVKYLAEHKADVDAINQKHGLNASYNRKPVSIKEMIEVQ